MKLSQNIVYHFFLLISIFQIVCYSQESNKSLCSFIFESDPEGVKVFINDTYFNITPCKIDTLLPGTYRIAFEKDGYERIERSEKLSENFHKRVFVQLEEIKTTIQKITGTLKVTSEPTNATVLLDSVVVGNTPFSSEKIEPGTYHLAITKLKYFTYNATILIEHDNPKIVNVSLFSKDSIQLAKKRKFRNIRRITFGALSAGFFITAAAMNATLEESILKEEKAKAEYDKYYSDLSEYDKKYKAYCDCVDNSNRIINNRKTFNIIANIFAAGFVISIPF